MEEFWSFLENLMRYGLEYFRVYPGVYRAQVVRNDDPELRGRIQIVCPEVGHRESSPPDIWVSPSFPNAGAGHGMFWPPEVGDSVRVAFEAGQASKPIVYWGGWYGENEVPTELGHGAGDLPTIRGFKTPGGHVLQFSDEPGDEAIRLLFQEGAASLSFEPDRTVLLENGQGQLQINPDGSSKWNDNSGNALDLNQQGVTITSAVLIKLGSAASSPVVKGTEWLTWASTHTHGSGVGPTTPPLTPPPGNILSGKVQTE